MVYLGMQGWRLDQAVLDRRTQCTDAGLLSLRMTLDIPGENRKGGKRVQQNLNNISQFT